MSRIGFLEILPAAGPEFPDPELGISIRPSFLWGRTEQISEACFLGLQRTRAADLGGLDLGKGPGARGNSLRGTAAKQALIDIGRSNCSMYHLSWEARPQTLHIIHRQCDTVKWLMYISNSAPSILQPSSCIDAVVCPELGASSEGIQS